MGLKAMPPVLAALPNKVGWLPPLTEAEIDRQRKERRPMRRYYHTKRWSDLRDLVLTEAMFICVRCGVSHGADDEKHLLHCDHIIKHNDDPGLFWDRANLQCLCRTCHNRDKQREEKRAAR